LAASLDKSADRGKKKFSLDKDRGMRAWRSNPDSRMEKILDGLEHALRRGPVLRQNSRARNLQAAKEIMHS